MKIVTCNKLLIYIKSISLKIYIFNIEKLNRYSEIDINRIFRKSFSLIYGSEIFENIKKSRII